MTNANWGGPASGQSGYRQHAQQGYSHPSHTQDPAWHGQPPVTRQEPQVQARQGYGYPQTQPQQPRQAQPQMQVHPSARAPQEPGPAIHPSARPQQPQQHYQPQPHHQGAYGYPEQYQAAPAHYAPQPAAHDAQAYYAAPPEAYDAPARGPVSSVMNGVGAVLSVALVLGLGVWGYQLAMRDVTEVPVIAALEGPMRIQPDNPGGEDAEHQGLAVNNVAADGAAEGPARQLVLAPPAERLDENDAPAVSASQIEATPTAEAGDSQPKLGTAPIEASASPDDVEAAARAMADQIAAGAAPLTGEEADLSMTPEAEERVLAAARSGNIVQPSVPGVAASPRPKARPSNLVTRASASPSSDALLAATQEATREVAPSDIPAGTRLVQLGAFDTEDVARAEWDQLNGRFAEYLDGKSRVIEKAQSGGKTFYRLRAMGFDDLSEARRLCSALMAGNASCIPVVTH